MSTDLLPNELWCSIVRCLSTEQLMPLALACRRFGDIVLIVCEERCRAFTVRPSISLNARALCLMCDDVVRYHEREHPITTGEIVDGLFVDMSSLGGETLTKMSERVIALLGKLVTPRRVYLEGMATSLMVQGRAAEAEAFYLEFVQLESSLPARTSITEARCGWPFDMPLGADLTPDLETRCIFAAVAAGRVDVANRLKGEKPLGSLAFNALSLSMVAARNGSITSLKYLTRNGVDVTSEYIARSPVDEAIKHGMIEAVQYLRALIVPSDDQLRSFILTAIKHCKPSIIRILVEGRGGAVVVAHNEHKRSRAREHSLVPEPQFRRSETIQAAVEILGFDVNASDHGGQTMMHHAAKHGDVEVLTALSSLGGDVHTADTDGRTAMHVAAAEGRLGAVEALHTMGAQPDCEDATEQTPFELAATNGHSDVAVWLAHRSKPSACSSAFEFATSKKSLVRDILVARRARCVQRVERWSRGRLGGSDWDRQDMDVKLATSWSKAFAKASLEKLHGMIGTEVDSLTLKFEDVCCDLENWARSPNEAALDDARALVNWLLGPGYVEGMAIQVSKSMSREELIKLHDFYGQRPGIIAAFTQLRRDVNSYKWLGVVI